MSGPWEYKFDNAVIENERAIKIMTKKIATPSATEATMKTGDLLKVTKLIRSQKTGALLPRQGTFVREVENFGRKLILVDFGLEGKSTYSPTK